MLIYYFIKRVLEAAGQDLILKQHWNESYLVNIIRLVACHRGEFASVEGCALLSLQANNPN
jgi:hypothetical protein